MDFIKKLDTKGILFMYTKFPRNIVFDTIAILINKIGYGGIMWLFLATFLLLFTPYKKYGVMIILADFLYYLLCAKIIKPNFSRKRPFQQDETIQIIINKPKSSSFPSGHSTIAFSCTIILFFMNPIVGCLALILSFIIAFSRVYLLIHYPSDVIIGSLIGICIGLLSYLIINFITYLIF